MLGTQVRARRWSALGAVALAFATVAVDVDPAGASNWTVSDETGYRAALVGAAADGTGPHTITLAADVTLLGSDDPVYTGAQDLTIDGAGHTLDGGGNSRILHVTGDDVNVNLVDVVVRNGHTSGDGGAGAGVRVDWGTVRTERVTVTANRADGNDGGGIAVVDGTATIIESTITGNTAGDDAGGIVATNVELYSSTVARNTAVASTGAGGGVFANDAALVENSTITDNSAGSTGGGIYARGLDGGVLTLRHATVVGNTGVGADNIDAAALVTFGSVVAGGAPNCVVAGGTTSSYSHDDDGTCGFAGEGDTSDGTDPALEPLGDNGGPTPTRLPADGSPLLDRIPPESCQLEFDQRGFPRPAGDGCDLGAVERQLVLHQLEAYPELDAVFGWPSESGLALTIDSGGDGTTDLERELGPGESTFLLADDGYDLQPGDVLTVTDGVVTKQHVVTDQVITDVDPATDIVTGTASGGTELLLQISERDEGILDTDTLTVGSNGTWQFDLAEVVDLRPGMAVHAMTYDSDNDQTKSLWWIARPTLTIDTNGSIRGEGWPADTAVDVTVDDPATGTSPDFTIDPAPIPWAEGPFPWETSFDTPVFDESSGEGFDLLPGFTVAATAGDLTKTHVVTALTTTGADVETDTVTGTAAAGAEVEVWVHDEPVWRMVTADGGGDWSADLGTAPDPERGEGIADLQPGRGGAAVQRDDDGDATVVWWQAPDPHLRVNPFRETVEALEFPTDATLTLTVGDDTWTATVEHRGNSFWETGAGFDLFAEEDVTDLGTGDVVAVTDGTITRVHEILELGVIDVDDENDTITGTAPAGSWVHIWADNESGAGERWVQTDQTGTWSAEYGIEPDPEQGWGTVDLDRTRMWGLGLTVPDDDGDATVYETPAVPGLWAEPLYDVVSAEASGLSDLTIEIPDLAYVSTVAPDHEPGGITVGPVHLDARALDPASSTYGRVVELEADLQPGMTVLATDVLWEMGLTVLPFGVERVDTSKDEISGRLETGGTTGFVFTIVPDPLAFGTTEVTGVTWSMQLCMPPECAGVFDIIHEHAGMTMATTDVDQPFDTFTGSIWSLTPHIVDLDAPTEAEVRSKVTLDVTVADLEHPDTQLVEVDWDDGSTSNRRVVRPGELALSHRYRRTGAYTITVTVTDGHGSTDTATSEVLTIR